MSQPELARLFHPHRSLLLTLLFLPVVGLYRFWDLRSYTGRELALLTGRSCPYSYRHTERFLLKLSQLDGDQVLTEALARWTAACGIPLMQGKMPPHLIFTWMATASPSTPKP